MLGKILKPKNRSIADCKSLWFLWVVRISMNLRKGVKTTVYLSFNWVLLQVMRVAIMIPTKAWPLVHLIQQDGYDVTKISSL